MRLKGESFDKGAWGTRAAPDPIALRNVREWVCELSQHELARQISVKLEGRRSPAALRAMIGTYEAVGRRAWEQGEDFKRSLPVEVWEAALVVLEESPTERGREMTKEASIALDSAEHGPT